MIEHRRGLGLGRLETVESRCRGCAIVVGTAALDEELAAPPAMSCARDMVGSPPRGRDSLRFCRGSVRQSGSKGRPTTEGWLIGRWLVAMVDVHRVALPPPLVEDTGSVEVAARVRSRLGQVVVAAMDEECEARGKLQDGPEP